LCGFGENLIRISQEEPSPIASDEVFATVVRGEVLLCPEPVLEGQADHPLTAYDAPVDAACRAVGVFVGAQS